MARFKVSYGEKRSMSKYENFTIVCDVEADDEQTSPEYEKNRLVGMVQSWADEIKRSRSV